MKLLALLLLCLLSCAQPSAKPGSIRISLPTEPPTLDWNLATDNVSYQVLNQLMEGLTQYDEQLNVIPGAAQSWEIRENGTEYIFHLNPNYRWSDGKPLTSKHFRDSWIRLLRPQTAAEYAYFLFDIVGARDFNNGQLTDENQVGIEAPDDLTLRVRLTKPVVFFPAITTFMVTFPIRADLIERHGSHWTEPPHLVTCGPYRLTEWWHEYRLTLEANAFYGGSPRPLVQDITIFLVSDPSTVLALYDRGQIDVARIPPLAMERYRDHADRVSSPMLRGYYYGFNVTKPPVNNPLLRQALALSLDKTEIPSILKGNERAADSWIPKGMPGFNEALGLKFNPEKARALLKEAGYSNGAAIPGLLLSFNSDATNKKIAEWAQAQWRKNLNVEVPLDNREWKSYLSLLKEDPPALFRMGWGADYPDPDNFMNLFTSYSGNNHTRWKNLNYDRLISDGASNSDSKKRQGIYDQTQKIILEDEAILIPLFSPTQNVLVREKLKPFPLLPLDFMYYKRVVPRP